MVESKVDEIIQNELANKKLCPNGETLNDAKVQVPSIIDREGGPGNIPPFENSFKSSSTVIPKKRGRKKGSKSVKKQVFIEDRVKEKLASISRNPKLKTTQELLADLQARGSNSNINASHATVSPNSKNNFSDKRKELSAYPVGSGNEYTYKSPDNSSYEKKKFKTHSFSDASKTFIQYNNLDQNPRGSVIHTDDNSAKEKQELTVKQILAKLPPLNLDSVDWSDKDYCIDEIKGEKKLNPKKISDQLKRLHKHCVECLNGNFEPKLINVDSGCNLICKNNINDESFVGLNRALESGRDEEFKEWHEMLARPSCDGEILHILPYVIID